MQQQRLDRTVPLRIRQGGRADGNHAEGGTRGGSTFAYNAAKETKAITPSGGSEQALSYGGTGQDDLVNLGSTTLQHSLLGLTREVNASGTSYYARTPGGLLIDQRTPSGNFNPLFDAQGDVIALVSSTGKVERTFHYGPYGENTESGGTQTIASPFGFKGGYRMPGGNKGKGNIANGLYHFGQRYYDPTTGRWTQRDPISQVTSPVQGNLFLFAGSDPVNVSDPSGRGYGEDCARGAAIGAALASPTVGGVVGGAAIGCGVSSGIRAAAELFSESNEEEEENLEIGAAFDYVSNFL